MKKVHTVIAGSLMLAVIVQFYLAAAGAFDRSPTEEAFAGHRGLGYVILLLAVVVTAVGAIARMPGRLIGLSGAVAALVVLQILIKEVATAIGDGTGAGVYVFGLHALNGMLIVGLSGTTLRTSRRLSTPAATERAAERSAP
ncbi:DUF6220 domain-containing protein [Pseudonocardia sp. CA-107938]|uniref:DUF6220 domain-containing protein n=1 Tax=Pseudonocardia sp. CA-107938 TaxID=3240021 RepID=UPI003D8C6179